MNFYNDSDPHAAAWLRNLIAHGLISEGVVDERPIQEVQAEELRRYTRCHFFAGIGGWDHALSLAGWNDPGRVVWTASCPCQPFSTAGKGKGEADPRHLWPVLAALVRECQPDVLFGEQVGSAAGYEWLDGVRADLEAEKYAFGAADLPACCQGAPHIRNRLFWVAHLPGTSGRDADEPGRLRDAGRVSDAIEQRVRGDRHGSSGGAAEGVQGADGERQRVRPDAGAGDPGVDAPGVGIPDTGSKRRKRRQGPKNGREPNGSTPGRQQGDDGPVGVHETARGVEHPTSDGREPRGAESNGRGATGGCEPGRLGSPNLPGCEQHGGFLADGEEQPSPQRSGDTGGMGDASIDGERAHNGESGSGGECSFSPGRSGVHSGPWDDFDLLLCADGKARRVPTEPRLFPLAHGVPRDVESFLSWMGELGYDRKTARRLLRESGRSRSGRLKGSGNAIVPPVAALFIRAFLDTERTPS